MSLRSRIITTVIGCSLITALICGTVSLIASGRNAMINAKQHLVISGTSYQKDIDGRLAQIETTMSTLAQAVLQEIKDVDRFQSDPAYVKECTDALRDYAQAAGENTENALSYYVRYNPEFTEPTSGIFASRSSSGASFEELTPTDFSTYDKSDTEHVGWYYIPIDNGGPTWMEPYQNENTGAYMISYVVPIEKDGVTLGVVGIDIDFTQFQESINSIKVDTAGYGFLLNTDNTILVHPSEETGKALSDISAPLADFVSNAENEGQSLTYQYNGERTASFSTLKNGMKLVTTVPRSDIMASSYTLLYMILGAVIGSLIVAIILGFFIGGRISMPVRDLTEIITDTAELNFRRNPKSARLIKLKDEIGNMARAVQQMRDKLREMVTLIDKAGLSMESNVTELHTNMAEVSDMCSNNSATSEELAAAMEEAASATETVTDAAGTVEENAKDIVTLSQEGARNSIQVKNRALSLKETTVTATERTRAMYEEVKGKTKTALKQAQAVERINELTQDIMDISSQTNLLALNASIEAARAGDAGRGFAVVATEIGSLASQTQETVSSIDTIIGEVNAAVSNMKQCLDSTMEFLDNTVLKDYNEFMHVGENYAQDAADYEQGMTQINDAVTTLVEAINNISFSIREINNTVNESATGVSDIADKTSSMVQMIQATDSFVSESKESADNLNKIVDEFNIE